MIAKLRRLPLWIGTLLAGIGVGACLTRTAPPAADWAVVARTARADPAYSAADEPVVRAVQRAAKAVVSIDTTARVNVRIFDDPFDAFWGRPGRVEQRERPTGAGSGVLLADGFVLTNQHVVEGAAETGGQIRVTLSDGRKLAGRLVGADRSTDIALIRLDAPNLPEAPLGGAGDTLLPGQTVIAIGNPVGLSASVSAGVVSALRRPIAFEGRTYEDLIQTDTAINPGNSGGALIDLGGRVVGINTLVRSDAQNIGFAIPIGTALRIAAELKRYGKVRRPWTGLITMDLTAQIREILGLPAGTRGVVVRGVFRGSPAQAAGLRQGDVIVEVNGRALADEAGYRALLRPLQIGDILTLSVLREGRPGTARLRLGEAP